MTAYATTIMSMVALMLSSMLALCGAEELGLVDAGANAVVNHNQVMCEDVRMKCAFGPGCSMALHNYFAKCDRMLQADSTTCPESCLYALVALLSTEDGKRMLDCTCRDRYCEEMKARVEVCRPFVLEASKNETVVPCELANWVCTVDPVCSAALGYFQTYCRRMMLGVACTERCLNSVEILRRQEKAAKMNRCRCTGKSAVDCLRQKERMVRLCYGGEADPRLQQQAGTGGGGGNKSGGRKNRKKHRPKMFDLDPDRTEVEMMMANADYQPDVRNRYNATDCVGCDDEEIDDDEDDDEGSGSATDLLPGTLLVVAASVYLVSR
ncbi:PREDICTED: growth arrest-specific protein 1-like [Diuraphis noxia]|uniref:growth arrest-specific protein 1-like n=1 Tax=Diuraphis noxia TaxID=143948 RepID=UPI000763B1CC|nr:PREDICTED: growth arrest-specific protein 1-like [Diuraphis noxia]